MATHLILGTAGHIDHGKTSLVRCLTGVNTDRLPEEKKRGITIDLGFAELSNDNVCLGIVDVPGHERFVRNMLAGATGVDIAMLVIAADDSIMPQTREHFEILQYLEITQGVIAVTKADLVSEDWLELVIDDIRQFVAGSFLADAPIIATSSTTGAGVDELRATLFSAAEKIATQAAASQPFRMAIDRTFTMAGHGTVVTGSVVTGSTQIGDELVIEPGKVAVRVRGIQNHERSVEQISRGQRAAINLAGIHHNETRRGQELASPGHLLPAKILTVHLTLAAHSPRVKNRSQVRLHVGTSELFATVKLLTADRLEPGESGFLQLHLQEPTVTTWKQPFVIRQESPVVTIGGGHVVDPQAVPIRHIDDATHDALGSLLHGEPEQRLAAAIQLRGMTDWEPADMARLAGVPDYQPIIDSLRDQEQLLPVAITATKTQLIHVVCIRHAEQHFIQRLEKLHQTEPRKLKFPLHQFMHFVEYFGPQEIIPAVLQRLRKSKLVEWQVGDMIGLAGHGPKLSNNERKLLQWLIEQYQHDHLTPQTVKQYQQAATRNQQAVPELIDLAVDNGELVRISDEYCFHRQAEQEILTTLRTAMQGGVRLTLAEIRDHLQTTRKYAVPLCEYLDEIGFTNRDGDYRTLN